MNSGQRGLARNSSKDIENWSLVFIIARLIRAVAEQLSITRRSLPQFIRIRTVRCCRIIWIVAKELALDCIDNVALIIAIVDDGDVGRLNRMQTEL
jgi:hypothetical protein